MDKIFSCISASDARVDIEKIEQLWDKIENITESFVILHGGLIVFERYAPGWNAYKPHYIASMAKSLVGGLSLMLAMDDGLINLDDRACKYIPQWRDDSLKSIITVRQLAAHTSGLKMRKRTGFRMKNCPAGKARSGGAKTRLLYRAILPL